MEAALAPSDITESPELVTATFTLRSGEEVVFRPLRRDDAALLAAYFRNLSDATKGLFAPHRFDQETADTLCAQIDDSVTLRMVVTTSMNDAPQIIGYFILVFTIREGEINRYAEVGVTLEPETGCTVAPSLADAYQDQGLGSLCMQHLIHVARQAGCKKMVLMGGVRQENVRGVHYYQKNGFRIVREFSTGVENYDMAQDL